MMSYLLYLLALVVVVGHAQDEPFHGMPLRVTSIPIEPYLMDKYPGYNHNMTLHDRYEGFIVELIHKMSQILGFKYRLRLVRDGRYGFLQPDGSWDGMIGEVLRKEADIAAAPIYITRHRAEVVDFTRPFLTVQATILAKKSLHGNARIKSVSDLLNLPDLQYGTLKEGMLVREFKMANDSVLQRVWQNMKSFSPSAFTSTNEEGIDRVRASNGRYAFILPNVIGDYISQQMPCDTTTVDTFLMERGFGLAVQKGSALLPKLNRALTLLEVNGFLHKLYKRWWFGNCNAPINTSKHVFNLNGNGQATCRKQYVINILFHTLVGLTVKNIASNY